MSAGEDGPLIVAGIDVGSSTVKVAILEDRGPRGADLLLRQVERIRRREPEQVAVEVFERCLAEARLERGRLAYVATTGEGEQVPVRTGHFYGMTTHARGATYLDPGVDAVVDIGALHTRAILVDSRSRVLGYRMTSQCASGSGQFLENICRYLGTTIDEIGPLSLQADRPESCSSICAVLAETDVINMVARGISTPNIIKGIHEAMAGRTLRLLTSARARGVTLVTGGLAADVGLIAALRESAARQNAGLDFRSHADSASAGAIGAALWGAFRHRKLARKGLLATTARG